MNVKHLYFCIFLFVLAILPTSLMGQEGPIKVEIKQEGDAFQLYRGGEPYYIKGVGGNLHLDKAKAYGANSLRTWSPDGGHDVLKEAHSRDMTVLMGLWVGQERQGFDYNDEKAVAAQLEQFRQVVLEYRDHPALLMWGIGNENDLFYTDIKVWDAINDIAKMIHELDPNHPTLHVTAGLEVGEVHLIKERAPHIDVYAMNTYGDLLNINRQIRAYGWPGPYVIAEWGPTGHWEVPKTAWNVPVEQSSAEKAASYKKRYAEGIYADKEKCLGSYVFLWGQKQETTPTWYGLFLESGEETEVMDELEYAWSGKWPENRAPHMESLVLNDKTAYESLYVPPATKITAKAVVTDKNGDPIRYVWELLPESTDIKSGGDAESRPKPVKIKVSKDEDGILEFKSPGKEGAYRLFLYAYDGKGKAATANFPFYVKRPQLDSDDVKVFR